MHIVHTMYLYYTPLEGVNKIEGKKEKINKAKEERWLI